MKRLLILVISAIIVGCGSCEVKKDQKITEPIREPLTCDSNEGYEYYCYSDAECMEYVRGYSAIVKQRFIAQQDGWFIESGPVQVIHVNLFFDHLSMKLIGRMEAEEKNGRVFLKYWGIICDIELNELTSFYKEGYSNADISK